MADRDRPVYCGQCGSLVQAEDRFCGVCGARIPSDAQDAGPTEQIPTLVEYAPQEGRHPNRSTEGVSSRYSARNTVASKSLWNLWYGFRHSSVVYRVSLVGVGALAVLAVILVLTALNETGEDLTFEEKVYVNKLMTIQDTVSRKASDQENLMYDYAKGLDPDVARASANQAVASTYRQTAKEITVPKGCEDHYSVWLKGINAANMLTFVRGQFLTTGEESELDLETYYSNQAREHFDKAEQLFDKVERSGCNGWLPD